MTPSKRKPIAALRVPLRRQARVEPPSPEQLQNSGCVAGWLAAGSGGPTVSRSAWVTQPPPMAL